MPTRTYRICFLGFGNVNRTLLRLLEQKRGELNERYDLAWQLTGVASRRLGWIAAPQGLDAETIADGWKPGSANVRNSIEDWLGDARPDVLFEATSLNVANGQPAVDYLRAGLEHGAHVISANKGPVVHAFRELTALAGQKGKRYLFEAAVMDGAPIFSLFRENLPAVELHAFYGILNSTTNVILTGVEQGLSFRQSLGKAQEIGVAETDPSHDVEGWDAAVKVAALITVLMGEPFPPQRVEREGIGSLTGDAVRQARAGGRPYKLVCRARRSAGRIIASVKPEQVPATDPMAQISGTSSIITFETDIFPALTITETNPGVYTTAYGMLADFIRAVRTQA
jgi:homoserine dehydrogenase